MANDVFGVLEMYPLISGGKKWVSTTWGTGGARTIPGNNKYDKAKDPKDPWGDFHCHEDEGNKAVISGTGGNNGTLTMSGPHCRFHIHPPNGTDQIWKNLEFTSYQYFTGYWSGASAAGQYGSPSQRTFSLRGRTNHHRHTVCRCNGRGYVGQIKFGLNWVELRKEFLHDTYGNKRKADLPENWPKNKLIGLKVLIQNCNNNTNVRVRMYIDWNGKPPGSWRLIADHTDAGGSTWSPSSDSNGGMLQTFRDECVNGCLEGGLKPKSDTIFLKPGADAYIRADYVNACVVKWVNVHEIAALA